MFLVLVALRLARPLGMLPSSLEGPVDLALVVYLALFGFLLLRALRAKLLWRIRRKLIISYLLIGLVPTVLILFFFLLSAYLVFGQISSYVLSTSLERVEAEVARIADASVAALESQYTRPAVTSKSTILEVLDSRVRALRSDFTGASAVFLGPGGPLVLGDVPGLPPGSTALPTWSENGYRGVLRVGGRHWVGAWASPTSNVGQSFRVLILVPLTSALERIQLDTGLDVQQVRRVAPEDTGQPTEGPTTGTSDIDMLTPGGVSPYALRWAALIETQTWSEDAGIEEPLEIFLIRFSLLDIYAVIATNAFQLGRALLILLGILAGLFLAIEILAILVGLLLARSITGSIHALSRGTDQIRRGNFSYKIQVRSRDQLGELAESFNLMTASVQELLRQSAEKERMEEELRIARQIQMSLLPKERVDMPGLSIAALCLPATEVGGDYYDFIGLDDQRLALLIADVSGKGTSAALYMAELKGLILSLSKIYDSPRQLLVEANKILSTNLDSRSFITMAYAVIDLKARRMTFARAGHNPILQLSPNGDGTQMLAPDGLGLALDRGRRFDEILVEDFVSLCSGDLFVFFTDGLSEAMNPRADLFGEARLRDIVERNGHLSPEELREKIVDEVFTFAEGEDQHDDMTMVLVRIS